MANELKTKFKFKCVLLELLKSDYQVTDDTVLEKLISHLSVQDNGYQIIDIPLCTAWARSVLLSWKEKKTSAAVVSFALRLMSIILEKEENFRDLQRSVGTSDQFECISDTSNCCVTLPLLQEVCLTTSKSPSNFSVKCALIKLLSSLLKHTCGRQWIMSSGLWKEVHHMSLCDPSLYVVREARKCLSSLLNGMLQTQDADVEMVLSCILEPFLSVPNYAELHMTDPKIVASLHLVSEILDDALLTSDPETNKIRSPVCEVMNKPVFALQSKSLEAFKVIKNEEMEELLSKIAVSIYILNTVKDGQKHTPLEIKAICIQILGVFNDLISKGSVENVLKLCVLCHNYWTYVAKIQRPGEEDTPVLECDERKYRFEDQLLCLQMLPMCVGVSGAQDCDILADMTEAFILKLTSLMHNHVHRMVYTFRSAVSERGFDERIALLGVSSIISLKRVLTRLTPMCVGCTMGHSAPESYFQIQIAKRLDFSVMRSIYAMRDSLVNSGNQSLMDRCALLSVAIVCSLCAAGGDAEENRERAVLVFQSFIYVLKHFVLCAESDNKQGGWGGEFRQSNHSTLLVAILDGLATLVRSHKITWRESVESLCLLTLAQELLDRSTFSSKVGLVVQALQLIKLCIENFMPPNLALLTNSLSGTSFDQLGKLIYKRLHDPNWEVRDSSLEVLLTLATISHTKYPLFQDLILDNKLCEVVVHLALNDAENYVCASAAKCLTAMVRVDRLWNEELREKDLVNKMIGILNGESEGVLRREASLLMTQIFKHRKVPSDMLHKMCVTMAGVVLSDLHWEVKVNALSFWELMIEHQMNEQGMIDGFFPQVTFSKEHRKIISLTPTAIQERLKKALSELSQNGCLHVLLQAILRDEDLEVVKRASEIILSLSAVLKQYGLLRSMSVSASNPSSSEAPAADLNQLMSPPDQSACSSESLSSVLSSFYEEDMSSQSPNDLSNLISGSLTSAGSNEYPKTSQEKSIPDLYPLGLAGVDSNGLEMPSISQANLQDEVIDSILNDRDINLLAKVYLGTGVEVTGRQGPETKVSKPVRPLVILSADDFLHQLSTLQINEIVNERTRWVKDTASNLETLLDDMLITRNLFVDGEDDFNAMDCY